jgi:hypothetical protein
MQESRIVFYPKGHEEVLAEALIGKTGRPVKVSYLQSGIPYYRSFLFSTAIRKFDSGEWVILSVLPLQIDAA